MPKKETEQIYKLTELIERLHQAKYPQATEQKIKWYAKQRVIFPQRLDPTNPKSKYAYTDKELQELRILFTFMMVYPYEIAKEMLTLIRATMEFAKLMADDEFVTKLQRTPVDIKKEPWATYHEYISKVAGEEIRLDKDQIWGKIQDATEQISQAHSLLSIINRDFMNAIKIAEQPDRVELVHKFEETIAKKANRRER
jgi:hypothetical protein